MTKKEIKKVGSYLVVIIILSVALSILGDKIDSNKIINFVARFGIFGPLVFIILLSINQIIAPLSGTPIYIAGYLAFGNIVVLYNYFSYLLAAVVNFFISRKWGRKWVIKLVGNDDMAKVDSFVKDQGIIMLIFLRALQSHISDFVSYAYGLTKMKFRTYIVISAVAPIPWLLFWKYIVLPNVDDVSDFTVWFFITMVPLFVISALYVKYNKRRKRNE